MSEPRTLLALLGFTPFERRSFQAFFELGREQGPGYDFTEDLRRADCAVADADDAEAMAQLRSAGPLLERTVLLGRKPHRGAALQLPRPINLLLVMRALDTLVGTRPRPGTRLATSPDDPPPRRAPRLARLPDEPALAPSRAEGAPDSAPGEFKAISGVSQATPQPKAEPVPTLPPGTRAAPASAPETPATRGSRQVQRVLDELAFRTATLPANIDVRALAAQAGEGASRRASAARRGGARPGYGDDGDDGTHGVRGAERPASPGHLAHHEAVRRSASRSLDAHAPARSSTGARPAPMPMEHILVIDQDATTLRLIAVQLQRFGFQIHLAGHPDDAMRLLTQRFHDYVFMDPALLGLDALLVCRLARQMPPPGDSCATTVVLLADPAAPAAPLSRALPAADGCLKKPIEQHALLKLVGEREVARVAYADTARMTTII